MRVRALFFYADSVRRKPGRLGAPRCTLTGKQEKDAPFCMTCGYSLVGHEETALCPECGARFDPLEPETMAWTKGETMLPEGRWQRFKAFWVSEPVNKRRRPLG